MLKASAQAAVTNERCTRNRKLPFDNGFGWLLLLLLAGGIPPIGHDSSIKVLVDCRLQQAAAAAPGVSTGYGAHQQQQELSSHEASRPVGGGWAAVAAAAASTEDANSHAAPVEAPNGSRATTCSSAAAASTTLLTASAGRAHVACATGVEAAGGSSRLFLQCGADAVIQLSFEQLLQLSSGTVADVADVPAAKLAGAGIAADAGSSVAEGTAAGQQQQGHPAMNAQPGAVQAAVSNPGSLFCAWCGCVVIFAGLLCHT
jgi:hypothetical protein